MKQLVRRKSRWRFRRLNQLDARVGRRPRGACWNVAGSAAERVFLSAWLSVGDTLPQLVNRMLRFVRYMVNTHTAAGRLMMLNLANYAQYERELISERTREALQHMKAQGVRLGVSSYGYRHSQNLDDKGRRILEPVAAEQEVIRQMAAWHAEGHQLRAIARGSGANDLNVPASRRGRRLHT